MKKSILHTRKQKIELRIISAAELYLEEPFATTRSVAKATGFSKTTVHRDFRERLPEIDSILADKVAKKLDKNLEARATRGGQSTATKKKKH